MEHWCLTGTSLPPHLRWHYRTVVREATAILQAVAEDWPEVQVVVGDWPELQAVAGDWPEVQAVAAVQAPDTREDDKARPLDHDILAETMPMRSARAIRRARARQLAQLNKEYAAAYV